MTQKAAIYHFTDKSTKRPKIYRDQLAALEKYAFSLGFDVTDIFCDMSLKRYERSEFDRFLACCDQYDALVTKDFYHIAKNTGKCMRILKDLRDKGVKVYSIENGSFSWASVPLNKPLNVATYACHFGTPNELREIIPVKNDIFNLFTGKKTMWTIVDQYHDESLHQKDGEQVQLKKLLDSRAKYDLLLVHNLNNIHWRTALFCKIREQLHIDIYSLQEGFLEYRKTDVTP